MLRNLFLSAMAALALASAASPSMAYIQDGSCCGCLCRPFCCVLA